MIKLFYARGSCSLATHVALEFTGVSYQAVRVDLSKGEQQSSKFLELNPKGRVPALLTSKGVLTETPALLAYVARTWPDANLLPHRDPFEIAEVEAFNAYLCATVHVAHAHNFRASRWVDDHAAIAAIKRKVPQAVGASYRPIEEGLRPGPWVCGEHFTICDIYLFTLSRWLERDGVDTACLPLVMAHRERVRASPEVGRVLAEVGES